MFEIKKAVLISAWVFALPNMAHAQTYIGVSAGVALPEDARNKGEFTANAPATTLFPAIANGTAVAWKTEYDADLNASVQIGHRFDNGFRVEAELNYTRSAISKHSGMTFGSTNIDGRDARILTRHDMAGPTPTVAEILNSDGGSEKSYGAFANVFYDINSEGHLMPYIGAGAGLQRTEIDYRPSTVDLGQSKETNFAWQVMAGATFKLTDRFELFGQYTYRDGGNTGLALDVVPARIEHDSRQSFVAAGIRVALGK